MKAKPDGWKGLWAATAVPTSGFVYDDGGRAAAGFKGHTDDCVCRAIAIVTGTPYKTVYDGLNEFSKGQRTKHRSSARTGMFKEATRAYLLKQGWTWTPTMAIGGGCTVHLRADEVPSGRLIVKLSGHVAAVIDGVLHDTFDCSRGGTRCVYGYYQK